MYCGFARQYRYSWCFERSLVPVLDVVSSDDVGRSEGGQWFNSYAQGDDSDGG